MSMAENKINVADIIKALQCVASQDMEGDCYCDHFNYLLTCEQFDNETRPDEKHMSCGGLLKDTQNCPYHQNTYGVCFEDGELYWLKDIVDMLKELEAYRAIGTVEELKSLEERLKNAVKVNEVISNMSIDAFAEAMCVSVCENTFQVTLSDGFKANVVTIDCVMELVMQIAEQLKGGAE